MFISNKIVDLRLCRGKNSSSAIERIAPKGATDEPAPAQGLQSHRQASQDSKAAREIRISQLTVSEQLRFLEEECGGKFIPGSREGSRAEERRLFWNALQPIFVNWMMCNARLARPKEAQDYYCRRNSVVVVIEIAFRGFDLHFLVLFYLVD